MDGADDGVGLLPQWSAPDPADRDLNLCVWLDSLICTRDLNSVVTSKEVSPPWGFPDDPYDYRLTFLKPVERGTYMRLQLLSDCATGSWISKGRVYVSGGTTVEWTDISMGDYWDDGDAGETCKFRVYIERDGKYLGPFNGPLIISRDFPLELLSALLRGGWGDKTVYAEIEGKNMLFYKVGPLTPDELRELIENDWGQTQQDDDGLIHNWDAAEVARIINEIWDKILSNKDKLGPEDLRTFITGLVTEYYRENEDFKDFVDALAEGTKGLDILLDVLLSLEPTGIVGILLSILQSPELPLGLQVLEIFFWLMLQNPSAQEPLLSLLEGVGRGYQQVDVVVLAVMLYGFAADPAFQEAGLTASFATAFFEALLGALGAGAGELDLIWGFLETYLIGLWGGLVVDGDILEESYADAVATALVACNAISYGWSLSGIELFNGRAMVHMRATIDGKEYHFYIHADASFDPGDLDEIPSFIQDVIDTMPDQPGITEGVIIPIFAATDEDIEQLESAIEGLDIPPGFPVLSVWVDRDTGEVKGECIAGCEGMDPEEVEELLDQAAQAQFGVGLGETWPGWIPPPPDPAEAAVFQSPYPILSEVDDANQMGLVCDHTGFSSCCSRDRSAFASGAGGALG